MKRTSMFEALAFSSIFAFLGIALLAAIFNSCTENQRARKFGGEETIQLEEGKRLEYVTWKGDQLWVLTRESTPGDTARTHTFHEKSSFGVVEGTITIIER